MILRFAQNDSVAQEQSSWAKRSRKHCEAKDLYPYKRRWVQSKGIADKEE